MVDEKKISAVEREVSKPSVWIRAKQRGTEDTPSTFNYDVNKEKIIDNYDSKFIRSFDNLGNEITNKITPPKEDFMRVMHEQIVVCPNQEVFTPIRQYCENKVLPTGTKEALFYDFSATSFDPDEHKVDVKVIQQKADLKENGARIDINIDQKNFSPIDIIASTNRAFSLESMKDENKVIFDLVKNDPSIPVIRTKSWMKYETILKAKGILEESGCDVSNLIMYTDSKIIRDLTLDVDLDSYLGFSRPAVITEATIERVCGANLIRDKNSKINKKESFWGRVKRIILFRKKPLPEYVSFMFIPNIAFGLVTGMNIGMNMKANKNSISVTGTQRTSAFLKSKFFCVKIISN